MCGLIGSINLNLTRDEKNASLKFLNHRGPDDKNYYEKKK